MALQAGVQRRVVQAEVQRGDGRRELVLLQVAQHRLLALADRLHPEE